MTANLDERVSKLEEHEREQYAVDVAQSEQIKSLFQSVKTLRNVIYGFCFIMLLAIIYGALGERGFNAVTRKSLPTMPPSGDTLSALPWHNDLERWLRGTAA